jgi:hypothetical protein
MNTWDDKLFISSPPNKSVLQRVHALFQQQRATWKEFRDNEALLGGMRLKAFSKDNRRVIVQANPGRTVSTNAKVDPESIAGRPCFLCPGSLPPLERGIAFGDYIILPNPYPILKYHMTIAFREHRPQQIEGRINDLYNLARALGPEMFVTYNGPRCGASAPDHMHFQACGSCGVPLFEQLPADAGDNRLVPLTAWGRRMLAGSFTNEGEVTQCLQSIISALKGILGEPDEPMINIVALYRNNRCGITLFPRAKHRSARYFAPPRQRISISPAAMEMAGIIVVADGSHFDRVDENVVLSMYDEVTLGEAPFARLVKAVV